MDLLSSPRWTEIDALFEAALEREPDERTAYLRAVCGDDPELYRAVSTLLASVDDAERRLGESATELVSALLSEAAGRLGQEAAEDLGVGQRVGSYRILREIGRGGMGAVYLAERADGAFERKVALKLVKRGMDTDEVLRRFHRERHVLASLDHPRVARLFDAGAAADGRPFLVMEFIEGEPITTYADSRALSVGERVRLFARVCEAVAYAHQRLVVHRDLKPGNVLGTTEGDVRLLDFGVAKLLDQDDAWTRPEERLLTPEYAAPEQLAGEPITTATDVYALGLILFELLTGVRATAGGPVRPSLVLTPAAAARRGQTAAQLRRRLRGDLDTITLKALHPQPERRYPSAEALLDDVHRHLAGQPVRARPDSVAYRTGKFVRRHRIAVGAVAVGALLLAAFAGVTLVQQRETERQRDAAAEVTAFMEELFSASDPFAADPERGDTLRARDLLERGLARARRDLRHRPALQARLLSTIGGVYERLGLLDEAEEVLAEALAVGRPALGSRHLDIAQAELRLASIRGTRAEYDAADSLLALVAVKRRAALGRRHPAFAEVRLLQGSVAMARGRYDEAETRFSEVLAIRGEHFGELHPEVAGARLALARLHRARSDLPEAEHQLRSAIEALRSSVGLDHPAATAALVELARVRQFRGDFEEAEGLLDDALGVLRATLGPEHPRVQDAMAVLATFYEDVSRYDEAERVLRELLDLRRGLFGPRHPTVARTLGSLALVLRSRERYDEAEPVALEAVALHRAFAPEHADLASALSVLGSIHLGKGDLEAAEAAYTESLAMRRRLLGDDHRDTGIGMTHLAELLRAKQDYDGSARLYREVRDQAARTGGPDHPGVGIITALLANVLLDAGAHDEAEATYREALEHMQRSLPAGHVRVGRATAGLGRALLAQERYAEAEAALLDARRLFEEGGHDTGSVSGVLDALYAAWGSPATRESYHVEARED